MGGIYRTALLLLFFVLLSSIVLATPTYHFQVTETGETEVILETDEPVEISLPKDAKEPSVQDGTFTKTQKGINVVPEGTAIINYATSYYTSKHEGIWQFETQVNGNAVVVLPQAVHVIQSIPRAQVTKEESWQLEWTNTTGNILVQYVGVKQTIATKNQAKQRNYLMLLFWLALIIIGLGMYYWATKKTRGKEERLPKMSEGQLNVIRAANPNEASVLKLLLKNNGHIKRNTLEHESGLSKSSLASSLKNLEKKNLISIDRTFFVHHVALSQWFKDLK